MVQVTGEEGITLDDYLLWQQAELVDNAFLQQDAFDAVDASTPLARQREQLELLVEIVETPAPVRTREEARAHFTALTARLRELNFAEAGTPAHAQALEALRAALRPTPVPAAPEGEAAGR